MRGMTTKIKTPHGSMFITINFFGGGMKEVFVIVSKPGSEVRACAEALGRVISLALQKGVPAEDIIETLENIKTEEVSWNVIDGKSFAVSSIPDGISKALKFALSLRRTPDSLLIDTSGSKAFVNDEGKKKENENKSERENERENEKRGSIAVSIAVSGAENIGSEEVIRENPKIKGNKKKGKQNMSFGICPKCHSTSLTFQEGCYVCVNCGYTKCS